MSEANIWDTYGKWDEFAKLETIQEVRSKITGNKVWRPNFVSHALEYVFEYTVDEMLGASNRTVPTAVDFGCGLGRNGPMLRRFFPRVVGIDLPEMVERVKSSCGLLMERTYDDIYSSISRLVEAEDFCTVYDSVVFQHIVDHEYLSEMVELLSSKSCFRTLVSIHFAEGMEAMHLRVLKEKGWCVWHSEADLLSFEGIPHKVVVFRRW